MVRATTKHNIICKHTTLRQSERHNLSCICSRIYKIQVLQNGSGLKFFKVVFSFQYFYDEVPILFTAIVLKDSRQEIVYIPWVLKQVQSVSFT